MYQIFVDVLIDQDRNFQIVDVWIEGLSLIQKTHFDKFFAIDEYRILKIICRVFEYFDNMHFAISNPNIFD